MSGYKVQDNSSSGMSPIVQMLKHFFPYAHKQLGFHKPVMISFQSDEENANKLLGKTAYYNPDDFSIAIYVDGRHPKDVLRSLSHELVHHTQNCNGDFESTGNLGPGYAQEDGPMRAAELDAYKRGNIIFRDFEDLIKKGKIKVNINFEETGEPKMSLKEWRNKELNQLLMEKWGLAEKRFANDPKLDKDGDGVPKWADKDDNDEELEERIGLSRSGFASKNIMGQARDDDEDELEEQDEGFDPTGLGKVPRTEDDEDDELEESAPTAPVQPPTPRTEDDDDEDDELEEGSVGSFAKNASMTLPTSMTGWERKEDEDDEDELEELQSNGGPAVPEPEKRKEDKDELDETALQRMHKLAGVMEGPTYPEPTFPGKLPEMPPQEPSRKEDDEDDDELDEAAATTHYRDDDDEDQKDEGLANVGGALRKDDGKGWGKSPAAFTGTRKREKKARSALKKGKGLEETNRSKQTITLDEAREVARRIFEKLAQEAK